MNSANSNDESLNNRAEPGSLAEGHNITDLNLSKATESIDYFKQLEEAFEAQTKELDDTYKTKEKEYQTKLSKRD